MTDKAPKGLKKHDTTSEWANTHLAWEPQIGAETRSLIRTMRNQIHIFLRDSAGRELKRHDEVPERIFTGVPEKDSPESIAEAIKNMTVSDIKHALSDLEIEVIRLTAMRAMVIATKKEIKKVINT